MARLLLQHVREERQKARALDRLGEGALLLRRHGRDAARHDLAALRDEALQQLHVLEIDLGRVLARERAALAPPEEGTPCAATAGTPAAVAAAGTSAKSTWGSHYSPPFRLSPLSAVAGASSPRRGGRSSPKRRGGRSSSKRRGRSSSKRRPRRLPAASAAERSSQPVRPSRSRSRSRSRS